MLQEEFPLWAAILVSFFVLIGSGLALVGAIGLARLHSFYDRIHAPTLSTSWGTAGIVLASIIYFSVSGGRFAFHEIFIGIFMVITVPVSLMLLGRSALYRDRTSQSISKHTTEQ